MTKNAQFEPQIFISYAEERQKSELLPDKLIEIINIKDCIANQPEFTIDSLFYNIKTNKIEELIPDSLELIKSRVIQTTVDPVISFVQEPIRLLKAVRYCQ